MPELGHVVFYVRDLGTSLRFYRELVGLELVGRLFGGRGAVLSGGRTHHELPLIEAGNAPGPLRGRRVGLYHVGWKIGNDLAALRAAKQKADELGFPVEGMADHKMSQSLYLQDPDGNEVELFVDDPAIDWRRDHSWLDTPVAPLHL